MPTTLQARARKAQRKMPDMKEMDKAFEAAKYVAPRYTMRAKTSFGAQIRKKMCESQDTAGPLDVGKIRYEPPQ